jgi:carbonic anhydrase
MPDIKTLLENNARWSADVSRREPEFFRQLAQQQAPEYLWIGCSDSRVPANQITGLAPGEVFVHRNVSNLCLNTDINLLSVLQYAVDILKVKHIIVCGHYGCGGVQAALRGRVEGVIDYWLNNIRDIYRRHRKAFAPELTQEQQTDLLCELNVIEQVSNLSHCGIVTEAWNRGQDLTVHGWIYGIRDGVIKDLRISKSAP